MSNPIQTGDSDAPPSGPDTDSEAADASFEALLRDVAAAPHVDPPMLAWPESLLDRYRVFELIAEGGMGSVYRGFDIDHGREVAIKVVRHAISDESRKRLQKEAHAYALLDHPHIVRLFGAEPHGDGLFLIMEFVHGISLHTRLRTPIDRDVAIRASLQLLDAVAHAHERGIIHRDIKPSNVLWTEANDVKLLDFGLVRFDASLPTSSHWDRTATAQVLGTPQYMAPEQGHGSRVTKACDVFSSALVITEMLVGGTLGARGISRDAVMLSDVQDQCLELACRTMPRVADVLRQALYALPDRRHPDASAFLTAMVEALASPR